MGCWNETCFLTRLPIFHGDPVSLILVTEIDPECRNTCHADGYYRPVCLPLHGEYDDYGSVEYARFDQSAANVLAYGKFLEKRGEGFAEVPMPSCAAGWDEAVKELVSLARREELYVTVGDGITSKPVQKPVLVQMAHRWAWDLVANCEIVSDKEYLDSTSFTIGVEGPLKAACMHAAHDYCLGPEITDADRIAVASLVAGMESMRMAFGPTSGSGSQDGLWEEHQIEFYKRMFTHAAASMYRYSETEQAPFTAAVAWDGNFFTTEHNNGQEYGTGIPTEADPYEIAETILEAGVQNILDAMADADTDESGE